MRAAPTHHDLLLQQSNGFGNCKHHLVVGQKEHRGLGTVQLLGHYKNRVHQFRPVNVLHQVNCCEFRLDARQVAPCFESVNPDALARQRVNQIEPMRTEPDHDCFT